MFEDVKICMKCGKTVEGSLHYECSEGGIGEVVSFMDLVETRAEAEIAEIDEERKRLERQVITLQDLNAALEKKNKELTNVINWLKGTK